MKLKKLKKIIAFGLTAAMFITAGSSVSAAGSAKVTRNGTVKESNSQSEDFEIDYMDYDDGIYMLYGYNGTGGSVVIPDYVNWIYENTFKDCTGITSVTIPDSVTDIGNRAFSGCTGLKSIRMGKSVSMIGSFAFMNCKQLSTIIIPDKVTSINSQTFKGCSELATVTIPQSVTLIETDAFAGCESLMDIYYTGTQEQWDKLSSKPALNSYTTVHCATPLKILTHPSNVTAEPGSSVSFTVKAQGDGLKYQWYYMKKGASAWSQWGSRTTANTTATSNESWDGMRVYCKVTDKYGNAVKSNPATITVTQELKITGQPVGATVKTGEKVTLSLKAEGIGLSYQWYFKKAGQASFSPWNGHTRASETVTPPASWDGILLYCKVTDKTGKSVNSGTVKIVLSDVLNITQQPSDKTVTPGNSVTLSLKAKGQGVTYQWYFKKAGQSSFSVWNGRTHASETVTPNESWNGIQLYCQIKDQSGNSMDSAKIKIVMPGVITVTQQPSDKTVVLGKSVTLSLKAEGDGLTYQWYFKKAGQSSFSAWNGRTHTSETVTPNVSWNDIQLYCLIKDSTGKSVKSGTIKVTVTGEALKITTQPVNKTVKLGSSVTVSLAAQGSQISYQWYYKKAGQSSFSAWNGRTHASETCTPNATWNGMQLYCLVKDAFGKSVKSNTITVTVTGTELKILTQPVGETVRLGYDYTISLKAQGVGLTYQWYYKKEGQSSFSAWKGHTHASETFTPTESWDGIQLYCIVKDSGGKSVKSKTVTIFVEYGSPLEPGEYTCCWINIDDTEYDEDVWDYFNSTGYYIDLLVFSDNTASMIYYEDYEVTNMIDLEFDDEHFISGDTSLDYYCSEGCISLYGWSGGSYAEFVFKPVEYYED